MVTLEAPKTQPEVKDNTTTGKNRPMPRNAYRSITTEEGCLSGYVYTEMHQTKKQTFVAFSLPFSLCLHGNAGAFSLVNK